MSRHLPVQARGLVGQRSLLEFPAHAERGDLGGPLLRSSRAPCSHRDHAAEPVRPDPALLGQGGAAAGLECGRRDAVPPGHRPAGPRYLLGDPLRLANLAGDRRRQRAARCGTGIVVGLLAGYLWWLPRQPADADRRYGAVVADATDRHPVQRDLQGAAAGRPARVPRTRDPCAVDRGGELGAYARVVRSSTRSRPARNTCRPRGSSGFGRIASCWTTSYPTYDPGPGHGHPQSRTGHPGRGHALLPRRRHAGQPAIARHADPHRQRILLLRLLVDRAVPSTPALPDHPRRTCSPTGCATRSIPSFR